MPDKLQDTDPTPVTTGAAPAVANPTPQVGEIRLPSNRELARLRKERFKDGPGSVRLDADPRGLSVTLVYVDGTGHEVGREPFNPGGPPPSPSFVPETARTAAPPPPPPPSATPAAPATTADDDPAHERKKK